jgi:hypothetical protein
MHTSWLLLMDVLELRVVSGTVQYWEARESKSLVS